MKRRNLKYLLVLAILFIAVQFKVESCPTQCAWIVPLIPTGYCIFNPDGPGKACGEISNFPWKERDCTGTYEPLICDPF